MSEKRFVPDNQGDEAFDHKNITTLKAIAELVQAVGVLADAVKAFKTIFVYAGL